MAQRFPPIYGKIDYVDSLQSRKYKNNLAGDSVLSTDTSGKFKLVKLSAIIPKILFGVVGSGGADDPVSGTSTFVSSKLVGLGSKIVITLAGMNLSNYGSHTAFVFTSGTGTINIAPNVWTTGSYLSVNLNQ